MTSGYVLLRRFSQILRSSCLALWWAASLNALAIVDANSSSNTNAPPDGSPWDNVGQIDGASGVYLGGGWVLTASHVGVGPIGFAGTIFSPDGTSSRLTNSDGSVTDLILFHLVKAPPLPSLPLASTSPATFAPIDMVGLGRIAGSVQTNVGSYTGFIWSADGIKSWGNNKVNLGGLTTIDIGFGNLTAFTSDFTSPGTLGPTSQTSDEAQASTGDSGGGVFQKNGSAWQLTGMVDAVQDQNNQPAFTAAYGDRTYMADIATYRNAILSVLNASPIPNLSVTRSGGNALICWPETGVNYTLETTATLSNPSWASANLSQFVTNAQVCALAPATSGSAFFRLRKP